MKFKFDLWMNVLGLALLLSVARSYINFQYMLHDKSDLSGCKVAISNKVVGFNC